MTASPTPASDVAAGELVRAFERSLANQGWSIACNDLTKAISAALLAEREANARLADAEAERCRLALIQRPRDEAGEAARATAIGIAAAIRSKP